MLNRKTCTTLALILTLAAPPCAARRPSLTRITRLAPQLLLIRRWCPAP
jgi:hypothetical protein